MGQDGAAGKADKGARKDTKDGGVTGKSDERSERMAELKAMLQEIELEKASAATAPAISQDWVVPNVLCLLIGWLCATIYYQDQIYAPPCAVCAVSGSDLIATASSPAPQPVQSLSGLPPLRVAVIDDKRGPGSKAVAVHRQAFERVGFRVTEELHAPYEFDVLWSHHAFNGTEHELTSMHRVNHIPGMSILCQKAQFGRFAHENRLEYVPRYYTSSVRDATYLAADLQKPGSRFVVKGRGHRGVRMMTAAEISTIAGPKSADGADGAHSKASTESKSEVTAAAEMLMNMLQENVVQQFITDGLLVDGHKFDFAVYCYIETFAPNLVAYTLENVRHQHLSTLLRLPAISYRSMALFLPCPICPHLAAVV